MDDMRCPQSQGQLTFSFRGSCGDDMRAELLRNLNRRGAHSTGASYHQHPMARLDLRTVRQHVHRGASRQRESRRGFEVN